MGIKSQHFNYARATILFMLLCIHLSIFWRIYTHRQLDVILGHPHMYQRDEHISSTSSLSHTHTPTHMKAHIPIMYGLKCAEIFLFVRCTMRMMMGKVFITMYSKTHYSININMHIYMYEIYLLFLLCPFTVV